MKIDEMDDLYEIVGHELKNGEERPGLMARAIAEADGNPEKAKSIYIRYRVAELVEVRQKESEKEKAERYREKIRELLKQSPLSIFSCEQILILLGFEVDSALTSGDLPSRKWTITSGTGSKAFLYTEEDLRKYTMSAVAGIVSSPDLKAPESSIKFRTSSALAQARVSAHGSPCRRAESHPEKKTSGQPDADQQSAALSPWWPSGQTAESWVVREEGGSGVTPPESPLVRSYDAVQVLTGLARAASPAAKSTSRDSVSHPEVKASKQPPDDEQWSEAIPKMAQPQKKQANWPLRIVLYIALLLAWIFAAGFLSVFIKGVRHGLLEQVLARQMDADQAATVVGVLSAVGQFVLVLAIISLAIVIWRKTRNA
jgi:hypothetical protein